MILSILIFLSIGNLFIIRKGISSLEHKLISLCSELEEQNDSDYQSRLTGLQADWELFCSYLQVVIRHDATDKIQGKLLQLSLTDSREETISDIQSLLSDLEQLYRKELPILQNIL